MSETEFRGRPRVVMNMNVVASQRDVLGERRDHIRSDSSLSLERGEELIEIRKHIQIIDNRWVGNRVEVSIALRCRPLITSDEWRKMIVGGLIPDDWEQLNARESNGQWRVLENAGWITQRPAPGVTEEGSDEELYKEKSIP